LKREKIKNKGGVGAKGKREGEKQGRVDRSVWNSIRGGFAVCALTPQPSPPLLQSPKRSLSLSISEPLPP